MADVAADSLLDESLLLLDARGDSHAVRSIPPAGSGVRPPMILHIVPVRRSAQDLFSGAHAIVAITSVVSKAAPGVAILQGLLDLTPAEARVARAIAQGHTTAQIAIEFGLSRETARTQSKSVLNKTGLKRNIDLASMLSGIVQLTPS